MARRCVWSRNLELEEAKARYRAVKNTTTMGCNARKTNKQTNNVRWFTIQNTHIAWLHLIGERDIFIHKYNKKQKYATADMFMEFFTSFLTEITGIFITRNYYRLYINTSTQKPVLKMPINLCSSWIQPYRALVLS